MAEGGEVPLLRYQEQKELWGSKKFDTLIVFGQGPVKPVLLSNELTVEQKSQWEQFKKDPLSQKEPDFRLIEGEAYVSQISDIEKNSSLSAEEKQLAKEKIRDEWQNIGRFGLNRWGRENALGAGLSLYLGLTDKLILSGGKTKPKWASSVLPQDRMDNWPSEASLMEDVIVRRFGELYEKKYGRSITEAIKIEDKSTNTLENMAYTINNNPDLLKADEKIGLLGSDFHLRRIGMLARIFSIKPSPRAEISAQELLAERAEVSGKNEYGQIQAFLKDSLNNQELREKVLGEETWERGLINENFLTYWVGYLSKVDDVAVIKNVLSALSDKNWVETARVEFKKAGLNFDDFTQVQLNDLESNPDKLQQLRDGLGKLAGPLRRGPSIIKDKPND